MPGKVYGIGFGPARQDLITPQAKMLLEESDKIYLMTQEGSRTYKLVNELAGEKNNIVTFFPKNVVWGEWGTDPVHEMVAKQIAEEYEDGKAISIIAFGDSSIYSPLGYIAPHLEKLNVEYELIAGLPYFLVGPEIKKACRIRDDEGLLVVGAPNISDFDTLFAATNTIIVYAVDIETLNEAKKYAIKNNLITAKLIRVGAEGEADNVIDIMNEDVKLNGGLLVLKKDPNLKIKKYRYVFAGENDFDSSDVVVSEGVYRTITDIELKYTSFINSNNNNAPALMLFHGGGWSVGSREQFLPHGKSFAAIGLNVFTIDYRINSKHKTSPLQSINDAQYAYKWLWNNADNFNIDPNKIVVGGASAGGHIALGIALFDKSICYEKVGPPKAYILFNPVTDTSENGYGLEKIPCDQRRINAIEKLKRGLGPIMIMHGSNDELVPLQNSIEFCSKARQIGLDCILKVYPGMPHGFFNYAFKESSRHYYNTTEQIVDFLVQHNIIKKECSEKIRMINYNDKIEALIDLARCEDRLSNGLEDVNNKLEDIVDLLIDKINNHGEDEKKHRQILNNIRVLIDKVNKLSQTYKYALK